MLRNPFKQIENQVGREFNDSKVCQDFTNQNERENFRLKQEVLILNDTNQSYINEMNRLKNIISNLDKEKDKLLNTIDEKTVENVKLKKENLTNNQIIENLNEQLTQMNTILNKITGQFETTSVELANLKIQNEYLNAENFEIKKSIDSSLKDSKNLQEDLITITRENQVLHTELEKSNSDKTRLKEQIQEYILEMSKLGDLIHHRDSEISSLKNDFANLTNELNSVQDSLSASETEKFNFKMEIQIKSLDIKRLRDKIDSMEKEFHKKISECQEYEVKQSVSARNLQRMDDQLKKCKNEMKELMKDLINFRDLNTRLEQVKDDLSRQLTRKEIDMESIKNKLDDKMTENELIKSQLNGERNMVKNLEEVIASSRQKDYQTQVTNQRSISEVKLLKDRIFVSEQKIQSLNKEIDRLRNKICEYEAENEILKRQLYNGKFDTVIKVPIQLVANKTSVNDSKSNL